MMNLNDLKYSIGKFVMPTSLAMNEIKEGIEALASFPEKLKALVKSITVEQENWLYRPDGWSIKQVIHHCADSHMQSVTRFRVGPNGVNTHHQNLSRSIMGANVRLPRTDTTLT